MTCRFNWITALAFLLVAGTAQAAVEPDSTARKLKGGESGTALESITVEGEDRVRVEFERPTLRIDVDPESAPGLDWEAVMAALDPGYLGLLRPVIERSAFIESPYRARPWLDSFREGAVARFAPRLEGVERWTLSIADSRGRDVVSFSGQGKPPKRIDWNGLDAGGVPVAPGLVYSYSVEAADKAGNVRNFVGDGFEIPPYTVGEDGAVSMLFALASLEDPGTILDVASRINQLDNPASPVEVTVTAPTFARASSIADDVVSRLRPLLLGDPARLRATTRIAEGATDGGAVEVRVGG